MDHREILASLTTQQRRSLLGKSDVKGLGNLALHFGAIVLFGSLIVSRVPFWPVLMVPLGVLIVFLFTLMHEAVHRTAFASDWLNGAVARVVSFLILLPAEWFKYFHFAHHRHTQDPEKDPELASPKPVTLWQYVVHVSGIPIWFSHIKTLLRNAFKDCDDEFVPPKAKHKVRVEALVMLTGYLSLALVCFLSGWSEIIYLWLLPMLFGQPFLRVYLLAEHGLCPYVANMLENTRTTFTNALVRKLAWNMPYHAEHHAIPTVPFHQLPELHKITGKHLAVTDNGYVAFNRKYVCGLTDTEPTVE